MLTKQEYAAYLGEIIGRDIDVNSPDLKCEFYGYFQSFMPDGIGIEKVFKPIVNGRLLHDRLLEIYALTKAHYEKLGAEGRVPGYFCPPRRQDTEALKSFGQKLISNLQRFAELVDNKEYSDTITAITAVEVHLEAFSFAENPTHFVVYEAISNWFIDQTDFNAPIAVLSEAYYSIDCDYYLSYYLQYPRYMNLLEFDLFEPYFGIWKLGYSCWFDRGKLVIAPK